MILVAPAIAAALIGEPFGDHRRPFLAVYGPLVALAAVAVWLASLIRRAILSPRNGPKARNVVIAALEMWAEEHHWEVGGEPESATLPARGVPFALGGERGRVLAAVRGEHQGHDITVLYFATGNDGRPLTQYFTVVAASTGAASPVTVAAPRRGFGRIASALGLPELEVESDAFNQRWRVVTADARGSHQILHPRVIDRLLEPDASALPVTWDAGIVLVAREGLTAETSFLDQSIRLVEDLAVLVPGYQVARPVSPDAADEGFFVEAPPEVLFDDVETWLFFGFVAIVSVAITWVAAFLTDLGAIKSLSPTFTGTLMGILTPLVIVFVVYRRRRRARLYREWAERVNAAP
jgi:hypothetical protein